MDGGIGVGEKGPLSIQSTSIPFRLSSLDLLLLLPFLNPFLLLPAAEAPRSSHASQPAIGHRLSACTEGGGSLCAELPRPLYARGGRRKKWPILGGWIILRAAKRPRGNALVVPSPSSRNKYWPMSRGLAPAPIAIILSRTNDISTGGGALPSFFLSGFGLGGLPIPIRIPLQLSSFRLFLPAPFPPSIIRPLPPPR